METNQWNTRERVLIVDDQDVIAITLTHIFQSAGYEARMAYSAEEALPLVEAWQPQLAVADVILPAMNGVDFALRLQRACPDCKVMLLSGHPASLELLDRAGTRGNSLELIAKPVPPGVLLNRAAELLQPAAQMTEAPVLAAVLPS